MATAEDLAPSGSRSSPAAAKPRPRPRSLARTPPPLDHSNPSLSTRSRTAGAMSDQATAEDVAPSGSGSGSGSASSPAAEDVSHLWTVEEEMPQATWVILRAVPFVLPSPDDTDFFLNIYEPPQISSVSVSPKISPDSETAGSLAYVVSVAPEGCFLLYATQGSAAPAYFLCDPHRSVASRLPDPAVGQPIKTFEAVAFISFPGASGSRYIVADLKTAADGTARATLFRHWTDSLEWTMVEVRYPSECSQRHPENWSSTTAVSNNGMMYWIDVSLGILTCDPLLPCPMLRYVPLPESSDLLADRAGHSNGRCWVGVSNSKLCYLQIDGKSGCPTFNLWSLNAGDLSWTHEYQVSFDEIWSAKALEKMKHKIGGIAIGFLHPKLSNVIYFAVGKKMYMVDLWERTTRFIIMDDETSTHFRLFHAWELPRSMLKRTDSSSSDEIIRELADTDIEVIRRSASALPSNDASAAAGLVREISLTKLCCDGVQIVVSKLGVSASSLGSKLLYLKEECSDAKQFFGHVSQFETTGQGYVAHAARKSAKASKSITKFFGGAASVLSYGGTAFTTAGFCLQRLHPQAQTGATERNSITGTVTVTVESVNEAERVLHNWQDGHETIIVDVPAEMETQIAVNIMEMFRDSGARVLVEKSPVLLKKAPNVLDDVTEWHLV